MLLFGYLDKMFGLINNGHNILNGIAHPNVTKYFLFSAGPIEFTMIMLLWLLFVTKLGPKFMKHKKPMELRTLMILYNFMLVVINVYFTYISIKWLEFGRKSLDPKLTELNRWVENHDDFLHHKIIYFYTKLFDLLDTVIFVLRKKSNQVSFLHVYHHFMVPVMGYLTIVYCPQTVVVEVFCFLNSIIHTIMYSYYLLSAFGPKIQPYLWWKRYITRLQIIQFIGFVIYVLYSVIFKDLSDYPKMIMYIVPIQPFFFFYMFFMFYIKSYDNKSKSI
ncbi:unnamed protein product [Medioppia subpectinata]|uniref:Elongation of very long chain fatty acids protein n=1 Tax=Medioppia subpectinata TaxID=1979941 RepID=A0A7R9KRP0_9ACAR|nr:unnamed protein product [Medioppia subpectinata]CAG2107205.1 unnamed protein product [Medioppia subpectinata]